MLNETELIYGLIIAIPFRQLCFDRFNNKRRKQYSLKRFQIFTVGYFFRFFFKFILTFSKRIFEDFFYKHNLRNIKF